jgi:competence protein ComEA
MAKALWKDYFSFSKKERIAVIILLAVITVFIVLPYFFSPQFKKPVIIDMPLQQLALQKVNLVDTTGDNSDEYRKPLASTNKTALTKNELFYFDPNTLDSAGWKKLGLKDKTIRTIINYRNKGCRFNQANDLRKIYGLQKEEADLLIPYVQIKSINNQYQQTQSNSNENEKSLPSPTNLKKININTATAEELKSLPGLGDVLSNRIVKFRNAVHGFKSVEDVRKTYGLSDSTYQLILPYLTISNIAIEKN